METLHDNHIHPFVDKTLLVRLYIFLIVAVLLFVYIIREIAIGDIFWLLSLSGICFGLTFGIILGRFMGITWHEEKSKVISKLDIAGGIALVLFVALDLSREWIFGHWIQGVSLTVFTLCVFAGAIFGRFLGMKVSIMRILKEKDIAKGNPDDVI